jgi:hypothetical protein
METELYQTALEPTDEVTITFQIEKGVNSNLTDLAEKRGISIEGLIHSLIKAELDKED